MRKIPSLLGASIVLLFGATSTVLGQAAPTDASCQPVRAALNALAHANRVRMSMTTFNGKPVSIEHIYVGDTLYSGTSSRHTRTPLTVAERVQADAETGRTFNTCQVVGRESVHGENASVFEAHMESKNPKAQSHDKLWISTRSGLPLRWDVDQAKGQFAASGSTFFSYGADVRAPAN
jgi:outer membrane lipoprotein-sorting protein